MTTFRPVGVDHQHVDGETALRQLVIGLVDLGPVVKRALALPVAQRPERRQRGAPGELRIALDDLGEARPVDDVKIDLPAGAVAADLAGDGFSKIETEPVGIVVEDAVGMAAAAGAQQERDRILRGDVARFDLLAGPKIPDRSAPVQASRVFVVLPQTQEFLVVAHAVGERPACAGGAGGRACVGEDRRAVAAGRDLESERGAIDADGEGGGAEQHRVGLFAEGEGNARGRRLRHGEGRQARELPEGLEPDADDVVVQRLNPDARGSGSGDDHRRGGRRVRGSGGGVRGGQGFDSAKGQQHGDADGLRGNGPEFHGRSRG